jgi:hypothetical protein
MERAQHEQPGEPPYQEVPRAHIPRCRPFKLDRDTKPNRKEKMVNALNSKTPVARNSTRRSTPCEPAKGLRKCSSNGTRKSDSMLTINTPNNARPRMMSIALKRSFDLAGRQSDSWFKMAFLLARDWSSNSECISLLLPNPNLYTAPSPSNNKIATIRYMRRRSDRALQIGSGTRKLVRNGFEEDEFRRAVLVNGFNTGFTNHDAVFVRAYLKSRSPRFSA